MVVIVEVRADNLDSKKNNVESAAGVGKESSRRLESKVRYEMSTNPDRREQVRKDGKGDALREVSQQIVHRVHVVGSVDSVFNLERLNLMVDCVDIFSKPVVLVTEAMVRIENDLSQGLGSKKPNRDH